MADVPALLFEYQILARAWWQLTKPDEPAEDDELAEAQEDQAVSNLNPICYLRRYHFVVINNPQRSPNWEIAIA